MHFVVCRSLRQSHGSAEVYIFVTLSNAFTRFSKVSTRNIFTFFQPRPELVLKLFLIFGQSEPHCSYTQLSVLIKKKSVYWFCISRQCTHALWNVRLINHTSLSLKRLKFNTSVLSPNRRRKYICYCLTVLSDICDYSKYKINR